MGGGSKGGTTTNNSTSSVSIPPDVLARYNSVNAQAQAAAAQPFTPYTGEFVAPVNQTQQGGINTIGAAGAATPGYFDAATASLGQGTSAALPYYGTATGQVASGLAGGTALAGSSLSTLSQGLGAAAGYNSSAGSNYSGALSGAQPYNAGATGLALAGTGAVNPGALNTGAYMSPYNDAVVQSTMALLNQQNQQQQNQLTSGAIMGGAYGGDRAGLASANLSQQQNLANSSIISGLYNQNYSQALSAAQQQQGVGLGAAQANRSALQTGAGQLAAIGQQGFAQQNTTGTSQANLGQQVYGQGLGAAQQQLATGQQVFNQGLGAATANQGIGQGLYSMGSNNATQLAGLGTGLQGAQIAQGQAQLGAGTVQQQTQQAQDTAVYNQFLQQQGYPFQVAQFLANIAEGTGALSGSTTTTGGSSTTPQPFFSDERLKENIHVIGKTNDGQPIIRFNYKGSPHTQIGLSAQKVQRKHSDAVGLAGGYKTVDYDAATRDSIKKAGGGGLGAAANDNPVPVMSNIPTGGGHGSLLSKGLGAADPDKPAASPLAADFGGSGGNGGASTGAGDYARGGAPMADGGSPDTMAQILLAHQAMYPGAVNPAGIGSGTGPRGMQLSQPQGHQLMTAKPAEMPRQPQQQQTGLGQDLKAVNEGISAGKSLSGLGSAAKDAVVGTAASGNAPASGGLLGSGGKWDPDQGWVGKQFAPNAPASAGTPAAPTASQSAPVPATGAVPAFNPSTSGGSLVPGTDPLTGDPISAAASSVADAGTAVADAGGSLVDDALAFVARGGRIKRYASGGAPYSNDSILPDDLYEPIDPNKLKAEQTGMEAPAQKSGSSGGGGGGGGGIGDVLGTGLKIASTVLPFFLKNGGRAGFQDGGDPEIVDPASYKTRDENVIDPSDNTRDNNVLNFRAPENRGLGAAMPAEEPKRDSVLRVPKPDAADVRKAPLDSGLGSSIPMREVYDDSATPGGGPGPAAPPPAGLGAAAAPPAASLPAGAPPTGLAPPPTGTPAAPPPGGPDFNTPQAVKGRMWIQESGNRQFNPDGTPVVSKAGAVGVTQIMPGTGPEAAKLAGLPWDENRWKHDAGYNKALGNAYYDAQYAKFGDPYVAAAAYNAGPAAVQQAMSMAQTKGGSYLNYLPDETRNYVAVVSGQKNMMSLNRPADPGAPSSGGLGAAAAPPASPPDKNFLERSGDWIDRNERPIVAGLTFLGNMLASPSHQLAGSIGSGLAAAAPAYANMGFRQQEMGFRGQELQQNQQRLGITQNAQEISLLAQLRQQQNARTARGLPPDPDTQTQIAGLQRAIASRTGVNSLPGGGALPASGGTAGAPAAPAPVALPTQGAPNPPAVQSAPLPPPASAEPPVAGAPAQLTPPAASDGLPQPNIADPAFRKQLDPNFDPTVLMDRANRIADWGDPNGQSEKLAAQAREIQGRMMTTGKGVGPGNTVVEVPGFAEMQTALQRLPENQKYVTEQGEAYTQRKQTRMQINAIKDVLEHYQSGALADVKAEATALGKALGIDVPDFGSNNPAAFQTFIKDAYGTILSNVGAQTGHATDALRDMVSKSFAGPHLQPEANRKILSQSLAYLDYADRNFEDTSKEIEKNRYFDRGQYQKEWGKRPENDLTTMSGQHEKNIAVRGDVPAQRDDLRPGQMYIMTPEEVHKLFPEVKVADAEAKMGKGPRKVRAERGPDGHIVIKKVQ